MTQSRNVRRSVFNDGSLLRSACALFSIACFSSQQLSAAASTLPSGGSFASGAGSIVASGNAATVAQSSRQAIINWNSFSIGKGAVVTFQNGSGATLNRVTGAALSSIL